MDSESIVYSIFLVFTGAAVIATLALYARQALLVAYIALGLLIGPYGLGMVSDPELIGDIAHVGIIFLLFLLGLNLEPRDLGKLLKEATIVTLVSSLVFGASGLGLGLLLGFNLADSLLIGASLMFSSTIIALKLLPTSALHHQRMGEVIVSILLLQDIMAVLILLLLQALSSGVSGLGEVAMLLLALPAVTLFSWLFAHYVLTHLFMKFDQIREYLFLGAIGWCLGVAELANLLGLSYEIGAFVAGVAMATNPIARFIAESLKPLRDFFLIMFFFALGAGFNLGILPQVAGPAMLLAGMVIFGKPLVFKLLLRREKEKERLAGEIGVRMGQVSEFSLLIAVMAVETTLVSAQASYLVQAATILTFIASSYWVVLRYPTPIAVSEALRRD